MEATPTNVSGTVAGPAPGVFRWEKMVFWLPGCGALGLLAAWAAVVARGYAAPLVLFPLVVGVVLGGAVVLLMRVLDVGHQPTIWLGALLAGLLTVAGQHYFTFWKVQVQQVFAADPEKVAGLLLVAPERVPPGRFWEFMTWSASRGLSIRGYSVQGGLAWLLWSLDGLLVLVPAMILVGATARLPYCDRCRQWYHTTRTGRIDSETAFQLSAEVETALGAGIERVRYRLLVCQGGCGPTGLVLAGEDADGRFSSGILWLDAAGRQKVVEILDRYAALHADERSEKAEDGKAKAESGDGKAEGEEPRPRS